MELAHDSVRYHKAVADAKADALAHELNGLFDHILGMADDAYLVGHPEWLEIVEHTKRVKALSR